MDLQTIFYILAIIWMTLFIFVMIGLIVGLIYLQQKINDTQKFVEKKINSLSQPVEKVVNTGTSVVHKLLSKFT